MPDILINIVLPTFVVILIGYIFGKIRKTANISPLVDIAFNIGAPALTFISILGKKLVLLDAGKIWAAALIIMLGCGIVAWLQPFQGKAVIASYYIYSLVLMGRCGIIIWSSHSQPSQYIWCIQVSGYIGFSNARCC